MIFIITIKQGIPRKSFQSLHILNIELKIRFTVFIIKSPKGFYLSITFQRH